MRTGLLISIFICWLSILSCTDSEDQIPTIIEGKARDVSRNIPSPGLKIYAEGYSIGSTNFGGLAGISSIIVDSTVSDVSGNFELIFNGKSDLTYGLSFDFFADKFGYYTDVIDDTLRIMPGMVNTRNIDAWKPIIIQLNLNILNNDDPNLLISNQTWPEDNYFFGSAVIIQEREIDTTVYLPAKPNSEHRIRFNYNTGANNEIYHTRYEFLTTELQDTLKLDFIIDCSSF